MLVEHGVDDMDKGFVTVENAVPHGQQVAFKPALALVFAEDFHDATIRGKKLISSQCIAYPLTIGSFKYCIELVGKGFVGAEDPEVTLGLVEPDHIPEETADHQGIRRMRFSRVRNGHSIFAKVGHFQLFEQDTSVAMRVGAHPAVARGS